MLFDGYPSVSRGILKELELINFNIVLSIKFFSKQSEKKYHDM